MSRFSLASVSSLLRKVCVVQPGSRSALYRRPYSQNANDLQPKVTVNQTHANQLYRNEMKPSDFDKKVLLWTGRYKTKEDIPEYVSSETLASSRNKLRIKVAMGMIAATLIGCVFMVWSGKKALREDRTLVHMNMEKKAKWREEVEKEKH
ncbi:unnamed protein product [Staurois parvus]|uniref:Uncharacterized protein n=1 Tax=Staurois parvus TaxID=386267 RepID=A0ABN9G4D1_9NEOB|nr:unnamed protein product [Staurois parvus]